MGGGVRRGLVAEKGQLGDYGVGDAGSLYSRVYGKVAERIKDALIL